MNELKTLKEKFRDLVITFKLVAHAYVKKWLTAASTSAGKPSSNFRIVLTIGVLGLGLGFFVAYALFKEGIDLEKLEQRSGSLVGSFFDREASQIVTQEDGSVILSNFEDPADLKIWKKIKVKMSLSSQYAWEGTQSAQITYQGGKEMAAVTIEELGRLPGMPSDWSSFSGLRFLIFHPGNDTEHLTFMVTDLWGKEYEEELSIPPGIWAQFIIPVNKIKDAVNIKSVNQWSLSKRKPGPGLDFYLDDVRLLPSDKQGGALTAGAVHYAFSEKREAWTIFDPQLNDKAVQIPFLIKNETNAFCYSCPVEGGIPLPAGEIKNLDTLRLRNSRGEDLPFQARILGFWPDRSIKWVGVHFETSVKPAEDTGFFLEYGPRVRSLDFASSLEVTENEDRIVVNTGMMEAVLNKKAFFLFEKITPDQNGNGTFEPSETITSNALLTLQAKGTTYRADLDRETYEIKIEEKGPQRAVIKASGWYVSEDGGRFCQAVVRYYFYQGKSYVKVSHTLVYTGFPENKQYKSYRLNQFPENETIEEYSFQIPFPFAANRSEKIAVGMEKSEPMRFAGGDTVNLYQLNYETGSLKRDQVGVPATDHFAGLFDISNDQGGMSVALRDFRENFPKAFKLNRAARTFQMDLWPAEAGVMDLSTTEKAAGADAFGRGSAFGVAKTHEVIFDFHQGTATQDYGLTHAASFDKPLIIRTNPYWIHATGALMDLFPVDPKYAAIEDMLERLFDWAQRHPQHFQWYGMFDFGDVLTWWREKDLGGGRVEKGWFPTGRWGWYNCEGVGIHTGALLQFVRSGKWKYFEFGRNAAKHIMDVDTVHYDTVANDKRIKNLVQKRYSAVGSMHRHNGDHWGGRSDEASHTSVVGLLVYYYLTGDERAWDVIQEVGEYFLTEPFSYIDRPDLAPNRAMANALWGDVLLFQATGDTRYKEAADKIIEIFLKGQQEDGSFLENYNRVLGKWSGGKHELYMAGYVVGALISYHEMTQDEAVKNMLLKLVRYLAPLEYTGPTILHGIAYAYHLTRDPFFIAMAEKNITELLDHRQRSRDPMLDGLIYEKPIYHRPMALLSTVPYAISALEKHSARQKK